jgi:Domain of unknown function (DUF4279)
MMTGDSFKTEPWPVVSLYLRFYSENSDPGEHFDPGEITRRLGIEPSTQFRPGDPITEDGEGRRRRSGWMVKFAEQETLQIEEMLDGLKKQIGASGAAVPQICKDLKVQAVILCGVRRNDSDSMPALNFSPSFTGWAASLELSINVDIIL